MAQIKLKILGFPNRTDIIQESTIKAKNIQEIVKHIESKYPPDYYSFAILLNGVNADDKSKILHDGDEVVIIPVMSGG